MRRKVRRVLVWSGATAAAATVVVAALHTPLVMQLMAGGSEGASCPFGADKRAGDAAAARCQPARGAAAAQGRRGSAGAAGR